MKIMSKKMIKPCTPTPENLRKYKISLTDQFAPSVSVPLIIFYSPSSPSSINALDLMSIDQLQQSLANILPRFYPLAGRYVRKDHFVHCNDEGVEFVEAHACSDNFGNISEYVQSGAHEQLNDMLLPRLPCEADEVSDPMVSIQVTRFGCGGLAIALSIAHRIFDADSILTFVRAWAQEVSNPSLKELEPNLVVNPIFDSPTLLPFKKFSIGLDIPRPRTIDPNMVMKRFLFNKNSLETLKSKVRDGSRRVSKVSVVCALISKAFIHADKVKHGRLRNFLILQSINIRDRTIPPFPKHSCGNITALATVKLCPSNLSDDDENLKVGFEDLFSLLRNAIDTTVDSCASIFNDSGDEGHNMLSNPFIDLMQTIINSHKETRIFNFTDWSKFDFYEADFGSGKPIWISPATLRMDYIVALLGNKDGDGIEAWVQLLKDDMALFEQDEDIIKLCTFKNT